MKKSILNLGMAALFGVAVLSCSKKEAAPAAESTTVTADSSSQVQEDKEVLSNDSATVETAVGVKDEEANAKKQEAAEAEKLKADEKAAEK